MHRVSLRCFINPPHVNRRHIRVHPVINPGYVTCWILPVAQAVGLLHPFLSRFPVIRCRFRRQHPTTGVHVSVILPAWAVGLFSNGPVTFGSVRRVHLWLAGVLIIVNSRDSAAVDVCFYCYPWAITLTTVHWHMVYTCCGHTPTDRWFYYIHHTHLVSQLRYVWVVYMTTSTIVHRCILATCSSPLLTTTSATLLWVSGTIWWRRFIVCVANESGRRWRRVTRSLCVVVVTRCPDIAFLYRVSVEIVLNVCVWKKKRVKLSFWVKLPFLTVLKTESIQHEQFTLEHTVWNVHKLYLHLLLLYELLIYLGTF